MVIALGSVYQKIAVIVLLCGTHRFCNLHLRLIPVIEVLIHWQITANYSIAILCFRVFRQVAKHSTEYRRYKDSFAVAFRKTPRELFGHCSGSRTKPSLVLAEVSEKYGLCWRRARRFRLLRCSIIKRIAWCLKSLCLNTRLIISIISSAIWAKFENKKHATSWSIWTCSNVPPKRLMLWRVKPNWINYNEIWYRCPFWLLTEFDSFLRASTFLVQMQQRRQNLYFDFFGKILVWSATADRPVGIVNRRIWLVQAEEDLNRSVKIW